MKGCIQVQQSILYKYKIDMQLNNGRMSRSLLFGSWVGKPLLAWVFVDVRNWILVVCPGLNSKKYTVALLSSNIYIQYTAGSNIDTSSAEQLTSNRAAFLNFVYEVLVMHSVLNITLFDPLPPQVELNRENIGKRETYIDGLSRRMFFIYFLEYLIMENILF